jgi:hypothetical protein
LPFSDSNPVIEKRANRKMPDKVKQASLFVKSRRFHNTFHRLVAAAAGTGAANHLAHPEYRWVQAILQSDFSTIRTGCAQSAAGRVCAGSAA